MDPRIFRRPADQLGCARLGHGAIGPLGTDDTGPVEIEPQGNRFDSPITFRYASGVLLKLDPHMGMLGGGHFIGTSGELFMDRGRFTRSPSRLPQSRCPKSRSIPR